MHAEVGALREVLAQQPVGVLVRAALPGAVGIAEVDAKPSVDPEVCVLRHLRPLTPVSDRRNGSGRVVIVRVIASRTASAPWPASAGPFLARVPGPWPAMRGRWSRIVNRVVRSTRVPIAELPKPRMRSPSQCPDRGRYPAMMPAGRAWRRFSVAEV